MPRPRFMGFAANTACICIFDLAAISSIGWSATILKEDRPTPSAFNSLFIDAAQIPPAFHVGIFSPARGIQIYVAPSAILSQQMAELFALQYAINLAISLKLPSLHVIGDNTGALASVSRLRGRSLNHTQIRILQRIFNILWWSKLPVYLYWIPSAFHPADPPSRLFSSPQNSPFHAFLHATTKYNALPYTPFPEFYAALTL